MPYLERAIQAQQVLFTVIEHIVFEFASEEAKLPTDFVYLVLTTADLEPTVVPVIDKFGSFLCCRLV